MYVFTTDLCQLLLLRRQINVEQDRKRRTMRMCHYAALYENYDVLGCVVLFIPLRHIVVPEGIASELQVT